MKMKETGTIKEAVFSFMIHLDGQSKMTLGGLDLQNMVSIGSKVIYHQLPKKIGSWDITIEKVTLTHVHSKHKNPTISSFEFGKNKNATIDSGTSYVVMPRSDAVELAKYFKKENPLACRKSKYHHIICHCSDSQYEDIPDIVFHFNKT